MIKMKLKSILSTSSLLVVLTILISSCGSTLNITKKRHSNGYYVNIGSDNYDNKSKPDTKKSDKKNQSEFIKDKTNNENLASNLEEGEADGKNLKQGENVNKKNSSAEQIASADFSKMSTLKKIKALKKLKKQGKLDDDRDFMFVLLILLSIILSPLAVFLHGNGVTNHFSMKEYSKRRKNNRQ